MNVNYDEIIHKRREKVVKPKPKTKKGGSIVYDSTGLPYNQTTGWHYASQPAPVVQSLSDAINNREFAQLGGSRKKNKALMKNYEQ
jgi:hypothetical protein